jgi:2-dehydro-3-deoxygluconokinase
MSKVVSFGEVMLRFNPEGYLRIVQADRFMISFAGAEANVAVSLANYGINAAFVCKVPAHELGDACVNDLRKYGVDTSFILRGGDRLGTYYVEKGASQRGSKVIYDRAYSSIAMAEPNEFDWDKIFEGADWFHFTGITPALSDNMAKACEDACKAAKARGIKISCDLNFRKKLWSKEKAGKVMSGLMQYVDVCIANEEDAHDVFGIQAPETDVKQGILSPEGYKWVAKKLAEHFNFEAVAITLRSSISANDNLWSGMYYKNNEFYFSREYSIHIVDRVGGGDSFGAGLIYSELKGSDPQTALEFAVGASCLKQSIEYDFNQVKVQEVEALVGGDVTGRVQR